MQEARALLGRYEYQKGNVEAALRVFEGIDIAAVTPKMRLTLSRRVERPKRFSQSDAAPPMSIHAVSLLLEAIYLKAKSLQALGRYKGTLLLFYASFSCSSHFYFLFPSFKVMLMQFSRFEFLHQLRFENRVLEVPLEYVLFCMS